MKNVKVLIVEDNRIVGEDIKQRLTDLGYSVTAVATSGRKALASAEQTAPDIALMDIKLGDGMNGIDTATELRRTYQIPIIYMTAYADQNTVQRAKKTEPFGYLVKPINDKELTTTLEISLYKHRMDRQLNKSKQWLETTLQSIGDGVIATDMSGRVTFMNPVAESLTGWNKAAAIGKPFDAIFNTINEITGEPCENPVDKIIKMDQIIGLSDHTLLISRDGRKIPIKDSGSPIRIDDTEELGVVLVFQDDTENRKFQAEIINRNQQLKREITERRQAEQKLKDNASMLHKTQQLTLTGSWEYDPRTDTITWSEQAYANYGIDPDKKINRKALYEIIHPDYRRYHEEHENLMLQKGEGFFEYPIEMPDGQIRWIYATAKVFYDEAGVPARVYGLVQNITERKLAEEALRESEKKYRSLFENAVEGFFQSTPNGRFLNVNPAFAKMLGYPSPETVIEKITDIQTELYVDQEDQDRYQRILRKNGKIENFEVRFRRKDGSKIWVSKSTQAYFNETGEIERYDGIVINISERKKAESEKIKLQAQLTQAQKLESIGNLAGGIAHDFNNILSSILGFTELALDDAEKDTDIGENLQEVYTAGLRASELVKQILTFARKTDEERRPIQIDLIIKEVLGFLRSSIPVSIEIKQDIKSRAMIMANATQLHQVLMNLCTNGAQAMEDEGGVLSLNLNDVVVNRSKQWKKTNLKPGNYAKIEVSDTGTGIPPDIIDTIFDPYFTTKDLGEGTGMGLAVVQSIVETHNGRIMVQNTPGRGATFTVYLPITTRSSTHDAYEPKASPSGTENILFVDDEAPIVRVGNQILSRLGYTVTTSTSSEEALVLFQTNPNKFDLVVTDMTMPKMTGDKLALELIKIQPDIPIILSTGYSKKISHDAASHIGIRAITYKPFVSADLAKTVRKVLDEIKK